MFDSFVFILLFFRFDGKGFRCGLRSIAPSVADVEVVDISDEAKGPPPPPNVFKQIDTDKDGKLSKEEIESFFKSMGKDVPEGLWENEDRDGSGFIDHDEFSGPKEDHESHDEL